jgi:hypothetical protein
METYCAVFARQISRKEPSFCPDSGLDRSPSGHAVQTARNPLVNPATIVNLIDRGHRDEGSFDDPGGTAELFLERWIAGHVDDVHLPVLPLGVLERHRDGELTLVLVIGRVRDGRPRLDRPKVFFPVWKRSASTSDVFPVPR